MIKDLKDGNKGFQWQVKNFSNYKKMLKDLAENGQHPFALIITCSDSRVVPEYIFDKPVGNLFVIRTAGNVINDGELATIEYAIEHLKIKTILVIMIAIYLWNIIKHKNNYIIRFQMLTASQLQM